MIFGFIAVAAVGVALFFYGRHLVTLEAGTKHRSITRGQLLELYDPKAEERKQDTAQKGLPIEQPDKLARAL